MFSRRMVSDQTKTEKQKKRVLLFFVWFQSRGQCANRNDPKSASGETEKAIESLALVPSTISGKTSLIGVIFATL